MTAPIQEPSVDRALQGIAYARDQLFRRPAPLSHAVYEIKVTGDRTTDAVVATGDGQFIFAIPSELNGLNLKSAQAFVSTVSSSGTPTVQIRNVTQAVDMLSTKITIDVSEFTSYTAATPSVVDAANDDVATADLIAVDVDVAGTGTKGLGVILVVGR